MDGQRDRHADRPTRAFLSALLVLVAAILLADVFADMVLGAGWTHFGHPKLRAQIEYELGLAMLLLLGAALARYGRARVLEPRRRPLLVAVLTFSLLLSNGFQQGSSDNAPSIYLPFAIVRDHSLMLDSFAPCATWWERYLVEKDGHFLSQYPPTAGILALPFYLPAALGRFDACDNYREHLGKIAAAFMTAFGAALLFLVFRALASETAALVAVALYVLCTPVLPLLGQALWQHTVAVLGFTVALYGLVVQREGQWGGMLVGLGCGLAVAGRAVDVFAAVGIGAALLAVRPRAGLSAMVAGAIPVGLVALYNHHCFGSIFSTGYGASASEGWRAFWPEGFAGLFLSPARGLFVYGPVLVLALPAFLRGGTPALPQRAFRILGLAALAHACVLARWWAWHGAWANAPRMISDVVPLLALGLPYAVERALTSRPRRLAMAVLTAASLVPNLLMTYHPPTEPLRGLVWNLELGPWDVRSYPPVAMLVQAGVIRDPRTAR